MVFAVLQLAPQSVTVLQDLQENCAILMKMNALLNLARMVLSVLMKSTDTNAYAETTHMAVIVRFIK